MTTSPAVSAPSASRPSHRLRRTLAAVCAGAAVAVVGVSSMPGTAQAAGVATGYRYLPTSDAASGSSLSPTSLPVDSLQSSAVLRYAVTADGSLRSI